MKQYCLLFKPLSSLSHIPDAQTIFGAICNIIKQTQGDEIFFRYIHSFKDEPILIHSSMFPEHLLPMIHKSLFSIDYINHHLLKEEAEEQLSYLQKMKQYKKLVYMSQNVYTNYIQNNHIQQLQTDIINNNIVAKDNCLQMKNEYISNYMQWQLNTHVQKNEYYMTDKNELYYDSQLYCDTNFYIYVKTTLSKTQLEDIFQYLKYFGLGPRHSVGKNSFELLDVIEKKMPSSQMKLLLSKSFVDPDFDLSQSYYNINSRIHRTSKYYIENQITGRYNLLSEGSYVKTHSQKEWYGQLFHHTINNHDIYYYGIGFVF